MSIVIPDPKIYFQIAVSVADAAAVNPNAIKTLLANGLSIFFLLKANQFLVMVLIIYLKILLIVLFYAIDFLIILYYLINYFKKFWNLFIS